MDLKQLIANIPSASEKEYLVTEIASSQKKFDELFLFMFRQKDPIAWRAAWIIDGCDEKEPSLSKKHLSKIINSLQEFRSHGVRRSFLRLLSRHNIPEKEQGKLADLCFQYMVSELQPVAVKVYAMQILFNLTRIYPELSRELITVIEDQYDNNSAGFKARGKLILRQLEKD